MSVKDEVKLRLDIVSVVGDTVTLLRSGRNFKANCPFHTEKTPSFYVFPDTQTWRCFGACASGGDVISFVMRQQGLDYSTALRQMAAQAGVEYHERREDPGAMDHLARLRAANEAAARYFHDLLLNSSEAKEVRAYVERRHITHESVRTFMLGYSLPRFDALKAHLEGQGYTTEELLQAGLLVEGERSPYDRFRGRLMFPIWDGEGRVIAFGARALDDAQPKYLNSSQSPLFDKSGTLYGFNFAKNTIRQSHLAVIVEGYMDALTAHQHGYANVVASMGTALTEKQVALLGRSVDRIVLALDSDAAGQNAILRGLETAPAGLGEEAVAVPAWRGKVRWQKKTGQPADVRLPNGVVNIVSKQKGEIRVLQLPHGKDPDELIRSTPHEWEGLVASAIPMMDFLLQTAQQRFDLHDPRGKSDAVDMVLPFIAQLPNTVEQAHYIQRLAALIGVGEAALMGQLAETRPRRQRTAQPEEAPTSRVANAVRESLEKSELLEDYCLALLLQFPDLRVESARIRPDHFMASDTRALFELWRDTPELLAATDELDLDLVDRLEQVRGTPLPAASEQMALAALAQVVRRLEERRLRDLKMHHRLRFVQEEGELGANEIAVRAYAAWQADGRGAEPAEANDETALVDVQGQELTINQQLQDLMTRSRGRRPEHELPVIT